VVKLQPQHREKLQAYNENTRQALWDAPLAPAEAHELAAKMARRYRRSIELRTADTDQFRGVYRPDQDRRKA
jgi:hypothetical protein